MPPVKGTFFRSLRLRKYLGEGRFFSSSSLLVRTLRKEPCWSRARWKVRAGARMRKLRPAQKLRKYSILIIPSNYTDIEQVVTSWKQKTSKSPPSAIRGIWECFALVSEWAKSSYVTCCLAKTSCKLLFFKTKELGFLQKYLLNVGYR